MAKTQIGAVIGIEGAKEYNRAISDIVRVTKEMESEIKLVEASFKNEYKTLKDINTLSDKHKQVINELNNKLKEQKEAQNAMNLERERAIQKAEDLRAKINLLSVSGKEYKDELVKTTIEYQKNEEHIESLNKGIVDMATAINETNTKIAEHEKAIRDLPSVYKGVKEAMSKATSEMGEFFVDVGKKMTAMFTVPFVAGIGASVKAAKDWETAFTGVKKTNDEIVDSNNNVIYSYGMLEEELQGIGLRTGSSLSDIATVAEISGQLGVATDQVAVFTEAIVMLADSTNLTAESGASYVATILNLMNHGQPIVAEQAYQLGNAIVYLGNNFNTTEDDIAHMATRLAPAAAQLNMTEGDVLGLATALSEAKITAEGGGTAMTQVLTNINKQIAGFREGTDTTLPRIAEIAGMTADVFADKWETRPIEAIDAFITGLSKLDEEGEYTSMIYDELGMSGIRQSLSLNALALTHEHLTKAVTDANKQFDDGNALSEEAEKRYGTLDSKIQQLKNAFQILGNSIGKDFLEPIKAFIGGLADMVIALSKAPDWVKGLVLGVGAFLAVIGPVLLVIGNIMIWISKVGAALTFFGTSWAAVGTAIGGAIAPMLGIVAAITAIVVAIKNWEQIKEFLAVLGSGIVEIIKGVIEVIGTLLSKLGSFIWETVKNIGNWVLTGFLTMFERLGGYLILFVVNTVPNFISNLINLVKRFGTMLYNNLTPVGLSSARIFSDLKSTIGNIFSSLASSAWSWGKDIISNLTSGIRSRISSLISSVKSVASTIWSYLHFSEPEKGALKDFHTWMPDMMQGMAQGIYDNMYLVDRAAATVADSLGMGGNTSYNYGGVVINLNVPQGANGYQLVDEIENALTQRTVRRRAVFG